MKRIFIYSWTISLAPETIIYGWGRDITRRQCVIRISDFYPWIYILLPSISGVNWSKKVVIQRFMYWLEAKLPDDCIEEVEYSGNLHDLYHYTRLNTLKVFFKDTGNGDWSRPATECIADCAKLFTSFVRVEGFPSAKYQCMERKLDFRKDVTLMIQFLSSTGVPMAGWVEFTGTKSVNNFSRETEEWTTSARVIKRWNPPPEPKSRKGFSLTESSKTSVERKIEIPDPLIMSFDCEMETDDTSYLRFPRATLKNDRIVQISAIFAKINDPEDKWDKYLLTLYGEECKNISGTTVSRFETEKQLLLGFAKLIRELQPDARVGHNSFEFDEPYITERCATVLGIWPRWSKLTSRLLYTPTTNESYEWQSGAFGKKELKPWDMPGCLPLDTRQVMTREFAGRSSYTLDNLAKDFLDDSKDPVKPKQIFEWFANRIHITRIGKYCVKDSVIPLKLIQTLALWDTVIQMADTFRLPILWLYTRGQQLKFRSQLSEECQKYGIVITTRPKATEGFEGAVVQAAIPGRHLWVLTFDFTSLYPSSIIAYNLDFTTHIRPEKLEAMLIKRPDDIHLLEFDSHVGCKHYPRKNAALAWSYDRTFRGVWRDPKSIGKIVYYSADPQYSKSIFVCLNNGDVWDVQRLGKPDPDFKPATVREFKDLTHNLDVITVLTENDNPDGVWNVLRKYGKPHDKKKPIVCGHFKHGFWKQHIRQGVVPRMLIRSLESRTATKKEIKEVTARLKKVEEDDKDPVLISELKKLLISLDKRQLSKKISSNSMYGVYGARTSNTPFIVGAACTTAIGRQAIQKAIDFIRDMYPDMELVYGDTDSCLLRLPSIPVKELFKTGKHIVSKINVLFPKPMYLEWEKLYKVFFQLTQKRYDGDIVDENFNFVCYDRKGTAMKRRDVCEMMREIYGRILERAKEAKSFEGAQRLLAKYYKMLANDKVPLDMLMLSSSLKPVKKNENLPQFAIAKKRRARGEVVMEGTRVSWILIDNGETSQYLKAEDPEYFMENKERLGLRLDKRIYAKNKMANQLDQLFEVGWGHKKVASNLVDEYFPKAPKAPGKRVTSLSAKLIKKDALEDRWKQVTRLRTARNRHRKYLEEKETELGGERVFKMAWKIVESTDEILIELIEKANEGAGCLPITWNNSYESSLARVDQLGKAVREVRQTIW